MMREIDASELRLLFESQTVEFKQSLSERKLGMEALDAMVNTEAGTGTVIFGIAPNGTISGIEQGNLDTAQRSLVQHINEKFDPPLAVSIELIETDGKFLLLLQGTRQKGVSYHEYDGRAWIKEGSTKRQLSLDEKNRIARFRNRDQHNGPWKCNRCGAWVNMLSGIVVTDKGAYRTYSCSCGGEFWPAI
jgi:predicted HTH transcriptional regulator